MSFPADSRTDRRIRSLLSRADWYELREDPLPESVRKRAQDYGLTDADLPKLVEMSKDVYPIVVLVRATRKGLEALSVRLTLRLSQYFIRERLRLREMDHVRVLVEDGEEAKMRISVKARRKDLEYLRVGMEPDAIEDNVRKTLRLPKGFDVAVTVKLLDEKYEQRMEEHRRKGAERLEKRRSAVTAQEFFAYEIEDYLELLRGTVPSSVGRTSLEKVEGMLKRLQAAKDPEECDEVIEEWKRFLDAEIEALRTQQTEEGMGP